MITTYLFSDPHIDRGDGPFTTTGGLKALNGFLDMVEAEKKKRACSLIAVGDLLELWADVYSDISAGPNGPLLERLMGMLDVDILGNHDWDPELMAVLFGRDQVKVWMQIGEWTIFHGHQVDPILNAGWKCWLAHEGDKLIEELNNPVFTKIHDWAAKTDRTNSPLIKALQETGEKFILGHSHHALDIPLENGGRYVNCGCWCSGDPHYVTVDDGGKVELHKWGEVKT